MLIIRHQQLQAFRRAAVQSFLDRLAEHLRGVAPELVGGLSPQALSDLLWKHIEDAHGYDLEAELDVARYVVLALRQGKGWRETPAVAEILTSGRLRATEKLNALERLAVGSGGRPRQP